MTGKPETHTFRILVRGQSAPFAVKAAYYQRAADNALLEFKDDSAKIVFALPPGELLYLGREEVITAAAQPSPHDMRTCFDGSCTAEHGAAVTVHQGDTLVVGVSAELSMEQAEQMKQQLRDKLPGVEPVIITCTSGLAVYRPNDVAAAWDTYDGPGGMLKVGEPIPVTKPAPYGYATGGVMPPPASNSDTVPAHLSNGGWLSRDTAEQIRDRAYGEDGNQ